jgi:hypothetical protein
VNEADVQEIANTVSGEHSEHTLGEKVTRSSSNAARKPDDGTVIRTICNNMSDDEKLDKLQSILKPDINYNFPTATFNENFKSGFSVAGL